MILGRVLFPEVVVPRTVVVVIMTAASRANQVWFVWLWHQLVIDWGGRGGLIGAGHSPPPVVTAPPATGGSLQGWQESAGDLQAKGTAITHAR